MLATLSQWNALDPASAAQEVLPCCGSRAWATQLAASRPLNEPEALLAASDRIWQSLPESDWLEAFATHPRIGERHAAASAQSLTWSSGEQAEANTDQAALAKANRTYEDRFNRTFIVCATGRTAPEILAILARRLANDPEAELRQAAEQQRQITNLRLRKWLAA